MTDWKAIREQVLNRIRKGIGRRQEQKRLSTVEKNRKKSKSKNRKVLNPQEIISIVSSIIIILIALGGIGLIFDVFAQDDTFGIFCVNSDLLCA
jgi:hypothetical protein